MTYTVVVIQLGVVALSSQRLLYWYTT